MTHRVCDPAPRGSAPDRVPRIQTLSIPIRYVQPWKCICIIDLDKKVIGALESQRFLFRPDPGSLNLKDVFSSPMKP